MEQYISKSALIAEIERIKKEECPIDTYEGRIKLFYFERFLSFINNLEVKEVDLEKEFKEQVDDCWVDEWSYDVSNWIRDRRGTVGMTVDDVKTIAKHFFELGMSVSNKSQKGE